jgi:uncharacterized protein (TIGR03492 family)
VRAGSSSPPRIVFLSNGHGEDVVGSRVAKALRCREPRLRIAALPLVGLGGPYEEAGIELLGPRRVLPSGGLLMHSPSLLLADLRAGFAGLTASQARFLAGLRCEALIVVGDVYAQLLGRLARAKARFVIQTLVSAHHSAGQPFSAPNRVFRERITPLERLLMRGARAVYVRDKATETALNGSGLAHARFLGNPIVDGLEGSPPAGLKEVSRVVALLPGSRSYSQRSLALMLRALERIPLPVVGAVAWVGEGAPEPPPGWEFAAGPNEDRGHLGELRAGQLHALVYRDRFADVLCAGRVVMGTSGTANEQAVAAGKPVVAFPVPPHYSAAFLANQKRLLGPALAVADFDAESVATAVDRWLADPAKADLAGHQGQARLGSAGGSEAIAADIVALSRFGTSNEPGRA